MCGILLTESASTHTLKIRSTKEERLIFTLTSLRKNSFLWSKMNGSKEGLRGNGESEEAVLEDLSVAMQPTLVLKDSVQVYA